MMDFFIFKNYRSHMWLKIKYQNNDLEYEAFTKNTIHVQIIETLIAPVYETDNSIRVSKIFPLVEGSSPQELLRGSLYFFDFENAFRTLGVIKQRGDLDLLGNIYFSYGSCSLILFARNQEIYDKFNAVTQTKPTAFEQWDLENGFIQKLTINPPKVTAAKFTPLFDYSCLPTITRTILDEFSVSIKILEKKTDSANVYAVEQLRTLVSVVNKQIEELVYLHDTTNKIPDSLYVTNAGDLQDPLENQILQHQCIERLIQINSSLSYVSTQSFSGTIPILERRSVIRRSSLLGIGSAVKALNRIIDYIEEAFNSVNVLGIITEKMNDRPSLEGLENLVHVRSSWHKQNLDTFRMESDSEETIKKLAYFSSRQAYRESEFSITASLNSVYTGLSLQWTLMTLTHEMLHSHVRIILASLFYSETKPQPDIYQDYYRKYSDKKRNKWKGDYTLLDSIREALFNYCVMSIPYGSLTRKEAYETRYEMEGAPAHLVPFDEFYNNFQHEFRNINEIFVHVLDLHYFYGGRTSKYIPLIWCSWSAIPHVNADIRQYILRSLLAIASKIDLDPYERWELSIKEFKTIIQETSAEVKSIPLINRLLATLSDDKNLKKYYFGAFKNSLIIVDIVMDIFHSKEIHANLWSDENIVLEEAKDASETTFTYNAPMDFVDIPISCPIPYLFYMTNRLLDHSQNDIDIERNTTIALLALNSK